MLFANSFIFTCDVHVIVWQSTFLGIVGASTGDYNIVLDLNATCSSIYLTLGINCLVA